ncbi:aminotransferase class V-fold PLP-dependent enzyme [Agarilytica rhodophyticola]|uniref:aminotransferase class V-fold PLP-dependent enzyme n=1 Tax=Agarilytica rhodophyticola TaxID=1737490 RepID=UPI000B345B05|nr:aminotransferase class V-fold PLP-dependent enzyme [Agarilytica rhodophyticola]
MKPVKKNDQNILSYAQERLWFLSQLENNSSEYSLPIRFSLYGPLNFQAYCKALQSIVERHEIFRTVIVDRDGRRYQKTLEDKEYTKVPVALNNLVELKPQEQVLEVGQLIQKSIRQPFDLRKDILLRSQVFELSSEKYVIFINTHYIAVDGWSLDIFLQELSQFYNLYNESKGNSESKTELKKIKYHYRDYAQWQRDSFGSQKLREELSYWKKQLSDLPSVHSLPLDKARPARFNQRGKVIEHIIHKTTYSNILQFCEQHKCSTFVFLHTILSVLISRYSRENDVVIGTPVSGRNEESFESIVGVFINTLVLRSSVEAEENFLDLLTQTSKVVTTAFKNQHVPFEHLVEELNPARSLSHNPLFQIMLTLKNKDKLPNLTMQGLKVIGNVETLSSIKYDLELVAQEHNNQLRIHWLYNLDLFEAVSIERFIDSFDLLVASVLKNSSQTIANLPLISDRQRALILNHYNENASVNYLPTRLEHLFRQHVDSMPEKIAIKSSDASYSFETLDKESEAFARILSSHGLKPGDSVGIFLSRSVESIVAILAVLKAGAVYVPIDPSFPKVRRDFIIDDANIRIIVSAKQFSELLPNSVTHIFLDSVASETANTYADTHMRSAQDPACILYTSGSTGNPKGVVLSHVGFVNRMQWMKSTFPSVENECWCQKTSLNFVDHIAEIFQALFEGVTSLVIDEEDVKDTSRFIELLVINRVTRITVVPSFLNALVSNPRFNQLKSLRFIISSGESLTQSLSDLVRTLLPQVKLLNIYGSTEISADVTYHLTSSLECDEVMQYFPHESEFTYHASKDSVFNIPLRMGEFYTEPDVPYSVIRQKFADFKMPSTSKKLEDYLARLNEDVIPFTINVSDNQYIGHMTSLLPNFMSEFSRLITILNQNLVKMETSKSLTFLERQAIAMVHREFFNSADEIYEEHTQATNANFGLIVSGGTSANITAMLSARNRALFNLGYSDRELREQGAFKLIAKAGMEDGVIICSKLAHYSIKKTANILGVGENNILVLEQDEEQKVLIDDLRKKIEYCQSNNVFVIAIIGIAGATETGTIDPLFDMANLAEQHSIHFHVDAAWGGSFRFSPVYKKMLKGIERADSVTFCAHKQLYLPQGISICLFREPVDNGLLSTHSRYQAQAGTYDSGQYTIEGSRPATALFLHAALHLLSRQGYSWLLEQSMENTDYFKKLIEHSDAFELVGKPDMNIINYRYIPISLRSNKYRVFDAQENDSINKATDDIQWTQFLKGKTFVSKTTLNIKRVSEDAIRVFRVVLSNPTVSKADLKAVLVDQIKIASEIVEDGEIIEHDIASVESFSSSNETQTVPIGKPIDNVKILLLDDAMQLVPIGVTGDVYVSGPGLALGYQNADNIQKQRFIENPWVISQGDTCQEKLFKTGDRARWLDNKELQYIGRSDSCVKIRGAMVDLAEIELLIHQLNECDEVAVVARKVINDDLQIVAYISSHTFKDYNLLSRFVTNHLKTRVPSYMIPDFFVLLGTLPKTVSGKINRKNLPLPDSKNNRKDSYIAARTQIEKDMCTIWQRVLKLDRVGLGSNFFSLGGHSLLAMAMLNQVIDKFGVKISLKDIFEHPVVEDLAHEVSLKIGLGPAHIN